MRRRGRASKSAPTPTAESQISDPNSCLLRLDASCSDDVLVLLELRIEERLEVALRLKYAFNALRRELRLHVGHRERRRNCRLYFLNDGLRRSSRHEQSLPGDDVVAAIPLLRNGWNRRRRSRTARASYRETSEPSRFDVGQHDRNGNERHRNLSRQGVGDCRRTPLIRNMLDRGPSHRV